MKKLGLFVLTLLMLAGLAVPAAAQTPSELTALARYFPEDSPLFAAMRTDDNYIQSVSDLMQRLDEIGLGEFDLPAGGLMEGFDFMVGEFIEGGTFANTFRAWLGDSAAVGIVNSDPLLDDDDDNDQESYLAAVEVTDREAAVSFVQEVVLDMMNPNGTWNVQTMEEADFTVFEIQDPRSDHLVYFAVFDDVLFISQSESALPLDGFPETTLSANADFQSAMDRLPEASYNIAAFVNASQIFDTALATVDEDEMEAFGAFTSMMNSVGGQAFGATILDDHSLVVDMVQVLEDPAALESFGLMVGNQPVDPAFAQYIPAGTPLVIHSTNLKGTYENLLASLRLNAEMIDDELDADAIEDGLRQIEFVVRGFTGLDFEEDILSWLTGDYALYLSLGEDFPTSMMEFFTAESLPVNFGILFEAIDPAKASALVEGIADGVDGFDSDNFSVSREEIGGANALVITITNEDMPFPVQLAVAADENVFALGTLSAVQAAMNPDGTLVNDPLFNEAAAYVLPGAVQVFYAAGDGLMPLVDVAAESGRRGDENGEQLRQVLTLFHSSSISQAFLDDGTVLSRAVLTLPE